MSATETTWTIDAIKSANRVRGMFFFDPDTMRFFASRVLSEVYQGPGGVYFVTSERPPHGARHYTVRRFEPPTGRVSTASGFGHYASAGGAKGAARRLAAG